MENDLRDIRLEQGLTLRSLERLTGINRGRLSEIENYKYTPTTKQLKKIELALGKGVTFWVQIPIRPRHRGC